MNQESLFGTDPQPGPQFALPDGGYITEIALRRASREKQIEVMSHWFHENYEDPAESTPYISAKGGYQFIWGGPYDPQEELEGEFGGVVPDDVIEELAKRLWRISLEWSAHPDSSGLDDDLFRSIPESPTHLEAFQDSIVNTKRLLETSVELADRQCFLRLLYVNVITALETYLSDNFIRCVSSDPRILRKFVESTPEFQDERIPLSNVFSAAQTIEKKVKEHLLEVVWHRLEKIKPMFRDTLDVEFPSDIGELYKAILVRHDLVHRSGKTKDGQEHVLNEGMINNLIQNAERLVSRIEAQQQGTRTLTDGEAST